MAIEINVRKSLQESFGNTEFFVRNKIETKTTKILTNVMNQPSTLVISAKSNTNQSTRKVDQIDPDNLSERDYFIQEIMERKGVTREIAASEFDFFC